MKSDKSGQQQKVRICLYTCCVVRAIHLEVVPNMTTSAFLRCLKRFAARRGLLRMFLSNNGKTFNAAAKAVRGSSNVRVFVNISKMPALIGDSVLKELLGGAVFEWMMRSTK